MIRTLGMAVIGLALPGLALCGGAAAQDVLSETRFSSYTVTCKRDRMTDERTCSAYTTLRAATDADAEGGAFVTVGDRAVLVAVAPNRALLQPSTGLYRVGSRPPVAATQCGSGVCVFLLPLTGAVDRDLRDSGSLAVRLGDGRHSMDFRISLSGYGPAVDELRRLRN